MALHGLPKLFLCNSSPQEFLLFIGLVPTVHWLVVRSGAHWVDHCRLLTMECLHGVPLTNLAAIRSMTSADPEQTLITALNTWFGSVLGCETFHADVHAGATCPAPILVHTTISLWTLSCCCGHCHACSYACVPKLQQHIPIHTG